MRDDTAQMYRTMQHDKEKRVSRKSKVSQRRIAQHNAHEWAQRHVPQEEVPHTIAALTMLVRPDIATELMATNAMTQLVLEIQLALAGSRLLTDKQKEGLFEKVTKLFARHPHIAFWHSTPMKEYLHRGLPHMITKYIQQNRRSGLLKYHDLKGHTQPITRPTPVGPE